MSHLIKEFDCIDVRDFISRPEFIIDDTYSDSPIYNTISSEKEINQDIRQSKFKTFTDKSMFDLADTIVAQVSALDGNYNYHVIKNDITCINYEVGGFFKSHEDYLTYKTNLFEEFTLIICADANCIGGQTIFHLNENYVHISQASVTSGHCLLFRKDIRHEGYLIEKGYKKIITLNLIGIIKTDTEKFICVSFPDSTRVCIITYSQIKALGETLLSGLIGYSEECDEKVLLYREEIVDPEIFEIIYKIYNRKAITINEYILAKAEIDYYAIDNTKFITYRKEDADDNNGDVNSDDNDKKQLKIVSLMNSSESIHSPEEFSMIDAFICSSEAEALYAMEKYKKIYDNVIPFEIIFSEGIDGYDYNDGLSDIDSIITKTKFDPVYMSVFSSKSIIFIESLCNEHYNTLRKNKFADIFCRSASFERFHPLLCVPPAAGVKINFIRKYFPCNSDNKLVNLPDTIYKDGKFLRKICNREFIYNSEKRVLNLIDKHLRRCCENITNFNANYRLPNKEEIIKNIIFEPIIKDGAPIEATEQIYPEEQKNKIIKEICSEKFCERIKNQINELSFELPQEKHTVDAHFCNESVYGEVTLINVYGFTIWGSYALPQTPLAPLRGVPG